MFLRPKLKIMDRNIPAAIQDCVIDHGPSNLLVKDVDYKNQGYHMTRISGYGIKHPLFAAVWSDDKGEDYTFTTDMSHSEFQKVFDNLKNNGYFLKCIDGYELHDEVKYAAIWEKVDAIDYISRYGLTAQQFHAVCIDYSSRKFRPLHISTYVVEGQVQYAAIWIKDGGPQATARYGMNEEEFEHVQGELTDQGYRLTDLNGCFSKNGPSFAAIWEQSNGVATQYNASLESERFNETRKRMEDKGFSATNISGYNNEDIQKFAVIWERPIR